MSKRTASTRRTAATSPREDPKPAEQALAILRFLGDQPFDSGRDALAVAFLMTCPSLEGALRLLRGVDRCHAAYGIDHDGFRTDGI